MEVQILDVLSTVVVPIATAALGWLGSAYRNKQKKEGDIMANFKQMMSIQNDFISGLKANIDERDAALLESKHVNQRLEAKLDRKDKSIRKANFCKFSNEGNGCPVLLQEEKNYSEYHENLCDKCEHRSQLPTNEFVGLR